MQPFPSCILKLHQTIHVNPSNPWTAESQSGIHRQCILQFILLCLSALLLWPWWWRFWRLCATKPVGNHITDHKVWILKCMCVGGGLQKLAKCSPVYPWISIHKCAELSVRRKSSEKVWCGEILMSTPPPKGFLLSVIPNQDREKKRGSGNFSPFCCPVKVTIRHSPATNAG